MHMDGSQSSVRQAGWRADGVTPLSGVWVRCTGYRPILDAAASFTPSVDEQVRLRRTQGSRPPERLLHPPLCLHNEPTQLLLVSLVLHPRFSMELTVSPPCSSPVPVAPFLRHRGLGQVRAPRTLRR